MRSGRLVGAGLAAVAVTAILAGPALADTLPETVSATGSPKGVSAICPQGLHPATPFTITTGDGTPLGSNQRWDWRDSLDGNGIMVWIGGYLNSPPPPPSITLTVSCIC